MYLEYIPNSARLHQISSITHGIELNPKELFSKEGVLITVNEDNPGVIPSSDEQGSGYITYCIIAKKRE